MSALYWFAHRAFFRVYHALATHSVWRMAPSLNPTAKEGVVFFALTEVGAERRASAIARQQSWDEGLWWIAKGRGP